MDLTKAEKIKWAEAARKRYWRNPEESRRKKRDQKRKDYWKNPEESRRKTRKRSRKCYWRKDLQYFHRRLQYFMEHKDDRIAGILYRMLGKHPEYLKSITEKEKERLIELAVIEHCNVCGEITTNREEVSIMLTVCKKCSEKRKKVIEK